MKNKLALRLIIAASLLNGCNMPGSKTSTIASDMCGCFNMMKDSLPAEGIKVFEKAAISPTPQETFQAEIKNLPPNIIEKVNTALLSTAKRGSAINNCIQELDKKYKTETNSQKEMTEKMVEQVKDKKGCEIMLALLRMNLKK